MPIHRENFRRYRTRENDQHGGYRNNNGICRKNHCQRNRQGTRLPTRVSAIPRIPCFPPNPRCVDDQQNPNQKACTRTEKNEGIKHQVNNMNPWCHVRDVESPVENVKVHKLAFLAIPCNPLTRLRTHEARQLGQAPNLVERLGLDGVQNNEGGGDHAADQDSRSHRNDRADVCGEAFGAQAGAEAQVAAPLGQQNQRRKQH